MRSLMFLLALVLFCSLQDTSYAAEASNVAHSVCCKAFTDKKIPLKQIVSYHWTSHNCGLRAIVFKTKAGKEICVDPEDPFVKKQVATLDSRTLKSKV